MDKVHVRDGQEIFNEDEIREIERLSAVETQAQENLRFTHSLEVEFKTKGKAWQGSFAQRVLRLD